MSRKPDSQEGATLPTSMFALNMNSMDQTDRGCPINDLLKSKEFTYIFQPMSIHKKTQIFSMTLTAQASSSWMLPSGDQSTLRQS